MENSTGFSIKKSLEVRSKCCSDTHGDYETAAKRMPKLISLNLV